MKKLKGFKKFIGLLTWQTSLILVSIAVLVLSGVLAIASPASKQLLSPDKTKESIQIPAYSDKVQVTINQKLENTSIFLYDNFALGENQNEEDVAPLNLDYKTENNTTVVSIYPGSYRIVALKEGYKKIEKDFVISPKDSKVKINLNFQDIEEEKPAELPDIEPSLKNITSINNTEVPNLQTIYLGSEVKIDAEIANYGKKAAERNVDVVIQIIDSSGRVIENSKHTYMQPTSKSNILNPQVYSAPWKPSQMGKYTIKIKVDSEMLLEESSKANNTAEYKIEVMKPPTGLVNVGISNISWNGTSVKDKDITVSPGQELLFVLEVKNYGVDTRDGMAIIVDKVDPTIEGGQNGIFFEKREIVTPFPNQTLVYEIPFVVPSDIQSSKLDVEFKVYLPGDEGLANNDSSVTLIIPKPVDALDEQ